MRKILACLLLTLAFFAIAATLATRRAPAERKAAEVESHPSMRRRQRAEPESPTPSVAADAADAAVSEILRIRRQQGDLLEGTLLEAPASPPGQAGTPSGSEAESEFLQMLKKAASEAEPPRSAHRSAAGSLTACEANYQRRVQAEKNGDDQLVASLRSASRRLDRKANDLETRQRFDQADQLRDLAEKARHEARLLEGFWAPSFDRDNPITLRAQRGPSPQRSLRGAS